MLLLARLPRLVGSAAGIAADLAGLAVASIETTAFFLSRPLRGRFPRLSTGASCATWVSGSRSIGWPFEASALRALHALRASRWSGAKHVLSLPDGSGGDRGQPSADLSPGPDRHVLMAIFSSSHCDEACVWRNIVARFGCRLGRRFGQLDSLVLSTVPLSQFHWLCFEPWEVQS